MRTVLTVALAASLPFLATGCKGGTDGVPEDSAAEDLASGNPDIVQPSEWWTVHPRPVYETLEQVGVFQDWFHVFRLTAGTFAIYEPNQFEEAISYLVEGSQRAVLVDTGNGIGDLRAVVEALTPLPISVVLTHEHYDHVAGAWLFDHITAYDNAASLERLAEGRSNESLQRYITGDYLWKPLPDGWDPSAWTIPPIVPDALVQDGDQIELGGRTLEVIYTPGHSPGSMSLLDREHRLLFTGDHFFPGPLYAYPEDVTLDDYRASNERLAEIIDLYDFVLSGHNDPWVPSEVIPRVSEAFDLIFSGGGEYAEADGLRRYEFDGFGILVRATDVTEGT